jgi:hypothetical protein
MLLQLIRTSSFKPTLTHQELEGNSQTCHFHKSQMHVAGCGMELAVASSLHYFVIHPIFQHRIFATHCLDCTWFIFKSAILTREFDRTMLSHLCHHTLRTVLGCNWHFLDSQYTAIFFNFPYAYA